MALKLDCHGVIFAENQDVWTTLYKHLIHLDLLQIYIYLAMSLKKLMVLHFWASKCLANILRIFSNISMKNTFIAIDTQVALSWLLSEIIKIRYQFVRYRIKDI